MATIWNKHERGEMVGIRDAKGNPVIAPFFSQVTTGDSPLAKSKSALLASLCAMTDQYEIDLKRLQKHALHENAKDAARKIAPIYKAVTADVIAVAQGNDASDERLLATDNDASSTARRSMIRSTFPDDMQLLSQTILNGNLETVQAFLEHPGNAPDLLIAEARDRAMLLAHIRLTGSQANFQRRPTADKPIDFGPDEGAALQAAAKAREWRNGQRENVKLAETTLAGVIDVVAVAADVSREEAFALLTDS